MATATRRVATYERVSSADQRERETIKTQTDALDRRLSFESDVEIVARYMDDGVSGTIALANRPAGSQLLRDAAAGHFDELWIVAIDRLGRDAPDVMLARRRFAFLGIRLMSLTGEVQPLVADLEAVIGDFNRLKLLADMARGMTRAAREGRYTGGIVPFGYRVQGLKESARLVSDDSIVWADQSAADIVRWIYQRLGADRWSCRRVAEELNARGVPTHYSRDDRLVTSKGQRAQRTQGVWRSGRIRNLVVNPLYRGELQYGRRTTKASHGREVISAPVEPLVSPALWHAAQEALAANRTIAKNTRRKYLLRGVIHCGIDGLSYCGTQGRGEVGWYRCTGQLVERGPLPGRCWGQSIRTDAIEPVVWADVERWLRDPGDVLDELDGQADREAHGTVVVAESITLARAIEALGAQRKQAIALNIRGRLPDAELDSELDRIAAETTELERRVAALEPRDDPDVPVAAIDLLAEVRARLDAGLTAEQRQEIVRLLVRVVLNTTTHDDGRKSVCALVTYRFPGVVETSTGTGSSRRRAGTSPGRSRRDRPGRSPRDHPRAAAGVPRGHPDRTPRARRGTARRGQPGSPRPARVADPHRPCPRTRSCGAVRGTARAGSDP
ncbi:MAG: recombinase family protein [Chloroflexi bacterium]|nr:recombinase family protein [Chloroflexota bacterium]